MCRLSCSSSRCALNATSQSLLETLRSARDSRIGALEDTVEYARKEAEDKDRRIKELGGRLFNLTDNYMDVSIRLKSDKASLEVSWLGLILFRW